MIAANQPPSVKGKFVKIKYVTQLPGRTIHENAFQSNSLDKDAAVEKKYLSIEFKRQLYIWCSNY